MVMNGTDLHVALGARDLLDSGGDTIPELTVRLFKFVNNFDVETRD